jgi:hypothetical protein
LWGWIETKSEFSEGQINDTVYKKMQKFLIEALQFTRSYDPAKNELEFNQGKERKDEREIERDREIEREWKGRG